MKKLIVIFMAINVSYGNSTNNIKIKDVCEWYHKEITGWYKSLKLFKKRHIEISDKTKYPDSNDKTIEKHLLKQKKLLQAIKNSENKIQASSKVYHYLECTRFEKKFEKN